MTDDLDRRVERLHEALRATEELPIERDASRWLGEAQAVVEGITGDGVSEAVVLDRVEHALELLSHVESTGNEAADERVEQAREIAQRIVTSE